MRIIFFYVQFGTSLLHIPIWNVPSAHPEDNSYVRFGTSLLHVLLVHGGTSLVRIQEVLSCPVRIERRANEQDDVCIKEPV